MNKAFVRDAEPTVDRCPRCGSIGQPVGSITLDAFVRPEDRAQLGETACFCPSETCFGFGREEIEADVREGVATRTRALIERAKSSEARCSKMAPNGQSCVPAVQRYFMKFRQR